MNNTEIGGRPDPADLRPIWPVVRFLSKIGNAAEVINTF